MVSQFDNLYLGFDGDKFFIENIDKNYSKNDKKSISAKSVVSPFWRSAVDVFSLVKLCII